METEVKKPRQIDLRQLVVRRFEKSIAIPEAFFSAEAGKIAEACWAMARRFHQGGRLLAFGDGAGATDAQHVAVEFVHPVIVGKRALPALALTNDSATLSGMMGRGEPAVSFAHLISVLARPQDIAMGFTPDGECPNVIVALDTAKQKGLLTLGLAGGNGGSLRMCKLDFCFIVPTQDSLVVQEVHETLYHILWELVHIFFEHEGLFS